MNGFTPVNIMTGPCQHAWSFAPTLSYYQCDKCLERHDHGTPGYEAIDKVQADMIERFTAPKVASDTGVGEYGPLHWRSRIGDSAARLRRVETGHKLSAVYDGKDADKRAYQVRTDLGVLLVGYNALAADATGSSDASIVLSSPVDGATGGGEVDYAEAARVMFEACRDRFTRSEQCYPAIDALASAGFITTPGGDLLEQAARTERSLSWVIAEAKRTLRLVQGCMECNADDERRWSETIEWLERLA